MSFQLGQKSGDYEFIDILDSTPNRVAYRVRNLPLNRFERLKVLGAAVQGDEEKTHRFLREASVHARLVHPNIVSFHDASTLDGQFVVTTEVVEGVTLAERLELGPIPIDECAAILKQVLAALACAHEHRIVHRGVAPWAISLTPDSTVKLGGFAFARADEDPAVTRMGNVLGDVHYLSPEQVQGKQALDPRSDLYSVGLLLYEMLTGRKPFEALSQFDLMLAQTQTMPLAPSILKDGLPPEWDTVVMKALAKDPAQRYQSADEFRAVLEAISAGAPAPATPVQMPPHPTPAALWIRPAALFLILTLLCLVALAMLVGRQ